MSTGLSQPVLRLVPTSTDPYGSLWTVELWLEGITEHLDSFQLWELEVSVGAGQEPVSVSFEDRSGLGLALTSPYGSSNRFDIAGYKAGTGLLDNVLLGVLTVETGPTFDNLNGVLVGFASNSEYEVGYAASIGQDLFSVTIEAVDIADTPDVPAQGELTVQGSVQEGELLVASVDALVDPDVVVDTLFAWEFFSSGSGDWVPIVGAVSASYQVAQDQSEVGNFLRVVAVTHDAQGGTTEFAKELGQISNVDDPATGELTVTGKAQEGESLVASISGLSDEDGASVLAYQWQESIDGSNWSDLEGSIAATYNIASDQSEVGSYLRVVATSTDAFGGTTEFVEALGVIVNVNDTPTVEASSNSGAEDGGITGTLIGSDVDLDSLKYLLVDQATHGSVAINETTGAYTYTPSPDFNGEDSFTFKVTDGTVDSSVAIVTLTVAAVNDVPLATPATGSGNEDADATGTLAASDVDQDTLKYLLVTDGANGSVVINETTGAYTYTPALDFNGTDSFTFKVNDGTVDSAAATVTLTVAAVNDAPVGFTVSVSGELVAEATLNAIVEFTSDADGFDPKSGFQHSWYSSSDQENWTLIEGETASSLTLTDELVGQYIQVTASYTDDLQTVESTSAVTTAAIEALGVNVDVSAHVAARAQTLIPGIELNGLTTNDQGLLQLTKFDGTLPMLPTKAAPSRAEASITLTDVLGALKVYLGKPLPTAYDNPYKYIAADFQGDGDVDLSDVLSLLKYYLGKPVESAPEWVFADAADEGLAADGNALSKSNATPHVIDHDLTVSSELLELVGILRGDVDGSWAPTAA